MPSGPSKAGTRPGKDQVRTPYVGSICANPMSFGVDGKQYVVIAVGWTLYVFGVP